jgi:pimeloyl-ACP methyl ester carboxylesterase
MRQIVTVQSAGYEFVGTWHLPVRPGGVAPRDRELAFLFFNAGHLPRDGHAGITVHAAELLAEMGHHALRFDLPGLGDSPGELPEKTDELFQMIHDGWYADPAVALTRELRRRHGFSQLVVGGLCGAAGTALLVAEREPDAVAGVVAIEMELFYPYPEPQLSPFQSLTSRAAWLRLLSGHSRYSHLLGPFGLPLLGALGHRVLPAFADRPLCLSYRSAVSRGLPVLVIAAEGKRRATFYDQVHKALVGGRPANLTSLLLPGTNHILTTGGAQQLALQHVSDWAMRNFPLRPPSHAVVQQQGAPDGRFSPALRETG